MATYLALCQDALRHANLGYDGDLPSVGGNLGHVPRLVVDFVRMAWRDIQTEQEWWGWMRRSFAMKPAENATRYPWGDLVDGGGARSIPDAVGLRSWLTGEDARWFVGDVAANELQRISYEDWREMNRGTARGHPLYFATAPNLDLCIYPKPTEDGHRLTITGEYQKSPQILAADGDVPEGLPEEMHDAILYRALVLIGSYNQVQEAVEFATRQYNGLMSDIRRQYLPKFRLGSAYS